MGTIFKPTVTKPLPPGATVVNGVARWTSPRSGACSAPVRTTPRGVCIEIESSKYLARYRDGQGVVQTVATGCKDADTARAVLADLERRAELVKAGVITPAQDAVADHKRTTIAGHGEAYLASLQAKGVTPEHLRNVRRQLAGVIDGCRFRTLADVMREPVERWLTGPANARRSARTRNCYLQAVNGFANWCVDTERLVANPIARVQRADEHAGRRRQPRALTTDELHRLLDAARRRPLAEALLFNRGWRKHQPGARLRPETVAKLEALGRERALAYKTLVLTGLRLGELTSLRVCDVVLDGPRPHLILDARHEKNRQGSTIPLRADLREDLAVWVVGRERTAPLFAVTGATLKVFDRDLRFAGIAKRDERGRTVCLHSLRHTFATMLSRGGVAPRIAQAAMRHSTIDLTMTVYTDPKLLDVEGALAVLPRLALVLSSADAQEPGDGQALASGGRPSSTRRCPSLR
jgi:integrase